VGEVRGRRNARPTVAGRRYVPNRIFVAYPWETYRKYYEDVCASLHKKYPVHFYAVGRERGTPATALYEKIKDIVQTSSYAVFDASKGNPNVSLEYGLAEFTKKLEVFLLIDEHTIPGRRTPGTPIIADLAGVAQNRWRIDKIQSLRDQLQAIAERHPYTKRFKQWTARHKMRGGEIAAFRGIIRRLDGRGEILRRELVDELVAGSRTLREDRVNERLKRLHDAALVTITRGREWASKVWIS
jgi:hypothetical protein